MTVNEASSIVIKRIRRSRKISQDEFGDYVGLARQQVSDMERFIWGVKIETVFKAAELFGMKPEELVTLIRLERLEREDD
jgi:transcriptional regulator with XRE-family HTH domain